MTQTFRAPAITCGGCANAIKRALGSAPGVRTVEVDIPGKNVTVEYDTAQTDDTALRARLEQAGFPVQ